MNATARQELGIDVRDGGSRFPRVAVLAAAAALAASACHAHTHVDSTVSGESRLQKREGEARALAPTVTITPAGQLAFVSPLVCPFDLLVEETTYRVTQTKPNMATFIVGLIAAAAGGVSLVVGLSDDSSRSAPAAYAGGAGLLIGVPLVVAPFLGLGSSRRHLGDAEVVQGEKIQPCGQRPVDGSTALVKIADRQVLGSVKAGIFAVSPFSFIDAFALHRMSAISIRAELFDDAGTRRSVSATLDATTLSRGRDGFLGGLGVDSSISKLRKVPRVVATGIEVARVLARGEPSVAITVAVENRGPGEAYGVRGVLESKNPQINGRMVYVGRLRPGASAMPTAVITMRADAGSLGNSSIAVRLLDAHATTTAVPFRFKGPIINRE